MKKLSHFGLIMGLYWILGACQTIQREAVITSVPGATQPGTESEVDRSDADWWKPAREATWQWQLSGQPVDLTVQAEIYGLDLFETDGELVRQLHASGRRAICYISIGSREDWRPDADQFPAEVVGRKYEGWEGEHWLDIRLIEALKPVLTARLDLCQRKGFDAVEPDNIDGYTNRTGFPLSSEDQLRFNRWIAVEAHARGLAIGLKNDPEQVGDLLPYYDFAITEDCFAEDWCEQVLPFSQAGKAVLAAEYTDTGVNLEDICKQAEAWGFSVILKVRELDARRQTCK